MRLAFGVHLVSTLGTMSDKLKTKLKAVKVDDQKRIIPKGDPRKPRYWRVELGKKFTGTKKQRKFFDTEKEALEFITATEGAKKERGHAAFDISQALALEARELMKQLEPHGVSLTDAVNYYLRNAPIAGRDKTVTELIPVYLKTKDNENYRRAQEISLKVFERDFGSKPIAAITAPAIEKWFAGKGWEPLNARNYMRDFSMFFGWAKLKKHSTSNPLDEIKRPKVNLKEPEIFTIDEARRLLEAARLNPSLGLLPMYAIGLFSGVRVEELERLQWEMIDWEEGHIRMPGSITKTGKPRMPEIIPALRAAIEKEAAKGPIVSPVNLRKRREQLHKLAGLSNKRNALRHSFASYHAAKHNDPGALQLLLGQQTPSVLFRHYVTATKKSDAEKYFSLLPPYEAPKEVAAAPHRS
jgi:integrase